MTEFGPSYSGQRSNAEEAERFLELFANRLGAEHALISQRMGWLLTLNSFLVAILGVAVANSDKFPDQAGTEYPPLAFILITAVAVLGVIVNTSVLFSNYWGSRAINEASQQLNKELERLPPMSEDERQIWCSRLRLYGRDPREENPRTGFWRPPSKVLHPWLAVPISFLASFALLPLLLTFIWGLGGLAPAVAWSAAALGPIFLLVAACADYAYHWRQSGLGFSYFKLKWTQRRVAINEGANWRGRQKDEAIKQLAASRKTLKDMQEEREREKASRAAKKSLPPK